MSSNFALQQTQIVQASQTQAGTEVQKGTVFRAQIRQDSAFVKRVARLCTESDVAIKQLHLDLKWLNLAVRKAEAHRNRIFSPLHFRWILRQHLPAGSYNSKKDVGERQQWTSDGNTPTIHLLLESSDDSLFSKG